MERDTTFKKFWHWQRQWFFSIPKSQNRSFKSICLYSLRNIKNKNYNLLNCFGGLEICICDCRLVGLEFGSWVVPKHLCGFSYKKFWTTGGVWKFDVFHFLYCHEHSWQSLLGRTNCLQIQPSNSDCLQGCGGLMLGKTGWTISRPQIILGITKPRKIIMIRLRSKGVSSSTFGKVGRQTIKL